MFNLSVPFVLQAKLDLWFVFSLGPLWIALTRATGGRG